jgi:transposase-like protein
MGQVLHGSATTTEAVRRAIQNSQESLRTLAKRYGINQKTVRKWRTRASVADLSTGPKEKRSTVLSVEEEAVVVAFRRHTLLPLNDCLYALQATILANIFDVGGAFIPTASSAFSRSARPDASAARWRAAPSPA